MTGEIREILFCDGVEAYPEGPGLSPVRPGGRRLGRAHRACLHDIGLFIGGEQSCLARCHVDGKQPALSRSRESSKYSVLPSAPISMSLR